MDSKEEMICAICTILFGLITAKILWNMEFHISGLRILVITIGTLLGASLGFGIALIIIFYLI